MKYKSLFDIWEKTCIKYSDSIAFSDNTGKLEITYRQAFIELCFLSGKLSEFGLKRYDHVSVFASNSPRQLIIEQSIITLGGVVIAKSPEISIEELDYVYNSSKSRFLVTDNIDILNHFKNKENINFILYTGNDYQGSEKIIFLNELLKEIDYNTNIKTDLKDYPDDISYISYTSGTSSQPKGAMLQNKGMAYLMEQLEEIKCAKSGQTAVVTCHISSMGWKAENLIYFILGCKTIYTHYKGFYETIEKFRPQYFEIPPKILQTIHFKLNENIKRRGLFFQYLFNAVYYISSYILKIEHQYKWFSFSAINKFFDKIIYKQVRTSMFNDDVLMDIGSAPLPKKLEDFYQIIGIKIVQSYGATETTGIAIGNTVNSQRKHPYSVGIPFKYNSIKIVNPNNHIEVEKGNSGLLLIKGPTILKGYYNNEEATQKALLSDEYYNTGDICIEDKDGYITILSRCDDVIVLTNGYNIYTRLLENEVKDSEYVNQIVIVGHGKPYLTALVTLNQNIKITDKKFLLEHLNEKIRKKDKYKYYEKLKDIYICSENFTVENKLLAANTLKIKYKEVYKKYQKVIDEMYRIKN